MAIFIEGLGYLASVLVAISLTMSNVWRLRWINLGGAIAFVTYAASIAAWPVLLVNAWITGVNIFYLRRMAAARDSFDTFRRPPDDPLITRFVEIYKADMYRYFPDFRLDPAGPAECLLIMRNMTQVGLVTYEWTGDDLVYVHTDYVTPSYRDFENGRPLYRPESGFFATLGAHRVRARAHVKEHVRYLRAMGFEPVGDSEDLFEKEL